MKTEIRTYGYLYNVKYHMAHLQNSANCQRNCNSLDSKVRYLMICSQRLYTVPKSAAEESSRNGTRVYLILLCHFMTQNQKLQCSPETFRLSSYGIQGVPKKIWAFDIPSLQGSRRKILFSTTDFQNLGSNWAQIFLGHPRYYKSLTWKFQDCTATFDSVS